ncbi:MAG: ACT domain-containing protein [Candidatus Gastranaerophilales bacterium]|nr:ACT domain-containing protein [Candidatus Gastranaerophilales bacterium]
MTTTNEDKIVITILGADKVGIVAKITAILAECNVNIEDIKQSIMQNLFVMFMLAKTGEKSVPFNELKDKLNKAAEEMKMEIWVQKKAIFDKMHTI